MTGASTSVVIQPQAVAASDRSRLAVDRRKPVVVGFLARRARVRRGDTARLVAVADENPTVRLMRARGRRTIARRVRAVKAGRLVSIAVRVPRRARPGRYGARHVRPMP